MDYHPHRQQPKAAKDEKAEARLWGLLQISYLTPGPLIRLSGYRKWMDGFPIISVYVVLCKKTNMRETESVATSEAASV